MKNFDCGEEPCTFIYMVDKVKENCDC